MVTTIRSRVYVVSVLFILLAALVVWHGTLAPAPALGAYPDQADLATDAEQHLGDRITVAGRVIETDPVTIVAEYGADQTLQLTIADLAISPKEGDTLRIYGVVDGQHTVRAINAFAVPPANYSYTYLVSFLAGLWVLARLVRYWRLDPGDWTLSPRPASAPLRDRARTALRWLRNH